MRHQSSKVHVFFITNILLFVVCFVIYFLSQTMLKSHNMSLNKTKILMNKEIIKAKKNIVDTTVIVDNLTNREQIEQVASENQLKNNDKSVVMIP